MILLSKEDFSIYDDSCILDDEVEVDDRSRSTTTSIEGDDISIVPNPNDGSFRIISTDNKFKKIELMDVQGRLLRNFEMNMDTNTISVEGLSTGLYYILSLIHI